LVYSTFLGGYGTDIGRGIAIDASENAYVTGLAGPEFPTTIGAFQTQDHGDDAFVARIGEGFVAPPLGVFGVLLVLAGVLSSTALVFFVLRVRRRWRTQLK
jgi:hypothetical protein